MNGGGGVAPGGHGTLLVVDGKEQMQGAITQDLQPEERLELRFDYGWNCTSPEDVVKVCVDHGGKCN